MKIIQKIRDFLAKMLSKHYWRGRRMERCARDYKRVDAKTLEDLCGYINPPYSLIVKLIKEAGGKTLPLTDDAVGMVDLFYTDRNAFIKQLKDMLYWSDSVIQSPNSLYERLKAICSPTMDEFRKKIKDKGLESHIVVCASPIGQSDEKIHFKNLKVEGKINLFFGGKFSSCEFNHVKFCNDATITIFPFYEYQGGKVVFTKNICCGLFSCFFPSIQHIYIRENMFRSAKLVVGANSSHGMSVVEWINHRMDTPSGVSSTIDFSDNYAEGLAHFYDDFAADNHRANIKMISFKHGNVIGDLSIPAVSEAYEGEKVVACFKMMQDHSPTARIGDVHFDMNERIKSSFRNEVLNYKKYFISLKNRAIEMRDREAEFRYGRQERYFDRCLADRWQDKFILDWSQLVSDSGISWARPIGWLILVQAGLAAVFVGWSSCDWDWWVWGKLAVESLDPLSPVKSECSSPLSATIYGVARKIFLFLFLYEIIKVFRRFPNKLSSE